MKTLKRNIAYATVFLLLAGCSHGVQTSEEVENKELTLSSNSTISYPIKTDVTLTYWMNIPNRLTRFVDNMIDTELGQELETRTGVKIKYIHPSVGGDAGALSQKFNLMIASGELPDIIEYNMNNSYRGGLEKALSDKVIISLNDYADATTPDLLRYLQTNDEVRKYCVTNSGNLVMFPNVINDKERNVQGPVIRKDILDRLGMPVPETMDEWYNTLKAIKESGLAEIPFSWTEKASNLKYSGDFTGAYGVLYGLWQTDGNGNIQYGPSLPEFKSFLTEFNKWYKEGLIDVEFAAHDMPTFRAKLADGKIAAYEESLGSISDIQSIWNSKPETKDRLLVAAPQPVLEKGTKAAFGVKLLPLDLNSGVFITTACKNPEVAAKFLNYGYTPEGSALYSYGIEGKSYTMQNGRAVAADFILNPIPNPDSLSLIRQNYCRAAGPNIQLDTFIPDDANAIPEYIRAKREVWHNVDNSRKAPELPPLADDAIAYGSLYPEIIQYTDEMFNKFIMGQESLDNYDNYVKNLYNMGLQDCIDIQQKALDAWKIK